ncbi:Ribosomal large subunit pseudouridine synthase A [Roseimaritima multifibrata]|uniref:tRNA uridine(34) hydroxylase n=1 Tax=Roseimaritima multifibrata TaxID=1930274 RepID=A0A517MLJ7_9BACT|nr:sulfurtransferase [Roseimaritima multifibrata]QDS95637.1 Ribosomal large subunit pseudouridine synthase A [Roseimaritima multifibrata]
MQNRKLIPFKALDLRVVEKSVMILNIAAYQFVTLDRLPERREQMRQKCAELELRGTVMLSPEGINCFLAGPEPAIRQWLQWISEFEEFADIEVKESLSETQPFNRMLVKLKKEIIAFGVDGIDPRQRTSPKLTAEELKQWLDEGREVTLLDVRNDYEIKLGTFADALPIGVDHFRHFPEAVDALPEEMKEKPLVMFCTGGIRCEKAGPLMQGKGFEQVYQLDGGILKYFETCGESHYDGDCFVFDGRVALDPQLQPTKAVQCFACQSVLTEQEQQDPRYVANESCPFCYQTPEQKMQAQLAIRQARLLEVTNPLPGSTPYDNRRPINVPERCSGSSLIDCLVENHPHVSHAEWEPVFAAGHIRLGDQPVEPTRIVYGGESYWRLFPDTVEPDVSVDIRFLYEDEALVAVHKPAPLPMHPCGRFNRNTLGSILNQIYAPQVLRPVHRLDANTTGIVVLARSRKFASLLHAQFQEGTVDKVYLVRCQGHPPEDRFEVNASIGRRASAAGGREVDPEGLPAKTLFEVIRRDDDGTALLQARPVTGRTNQIRIHLWHLNMPVVGDPVYLPDQQLGKSQTLSLTQPPMALHAWQLTFRSPATEQDLTLKSDPPFSLEPGNGELVSVQVR